MGFQQSAWTTQPHQDDSYNHLLRALLDHQYTVLVATQSVGASSDPSQLSVLRSHELNKELQEVKRLLDLSHITFEDS